MTYRVESEKKLTQAEIDEIMEESKHECDQCFIVLFIGMFLGACSVASAWCLCHVFLR